MIFSVANYILAVKHLDRMARTLGAKRIYALGEEHDREALKCSVGNSVLVVQVMCEGKRMAMRIYMRPNANLRAIYGDSYYPKELLVSSSCDVFGLADVVLCDWKEGVSLQSKIEELAHKPDKMAALSQMFEEFALSLLGEKWAHGDLKPENIIFSKDGLSLIDFDAMYCEGFGSENCTNIFEGYIAWLGKLLKLDFGNSFKYGIPVIDVIKDHMGVSFAVAAIATIFEFLIATIFEFLIAIPLGVTAATHQYSVRDYIVTVLVMIGISLPSFFFGQLLKNIFAIQLEWFPASGLIDASKDLSGFALLMDQMWHLFIPILTVVILSIGGRMRMTRTNMLEVLNSDYIRTARAKGLKEKVVIYKHAFRNTMIPLVTSLAGLLPGLFSGAIITEQVFGLPGIGNVAFDAMLVADIPFIMGYNMFLALLSVIGVLLADLMYAVVDPRVKLG